MHLYKTFLQEIFKLYLFGQVTDKNKLTSYKWKGNYRTYCVIDYTETVVVSETRD